MFTILNIAIVLTIKICIMDSKVRFIVRQNWIRAQYNNYYTS